MKIKKTKDGYIVFEEPRFYYDISISKIKSEGLEKWLNHLSEKRWFTPSVRSEFTKIIQNYNG